MGNAVHEIGWIGIGVMGHSMAGHLLEAGHRLRVHTRTKSRAAELLARGAVWADSPRAAADGAAIVCSMVGFPHDVEEIHLGERGTLSAPRVPPILVDFTTSAPSLAVRIADVARERACASLDAPVSGGDVGARNATLSIMVGGEEAAFAQALPVFELLGKTVVRQGGPGAGQHTKMVNQILIAGTMVGVCEGLVYAHRAGLDPHAVVTSVGGGAAGSWTVANLVPRMLRGDFGPGFFVEHFVKDLGIALDEATRMGLDLPGLSYARELYAAAAGAGEERSGTHALFRFLMRRAGMSVAR